MATIQEMIAAEEAALAAAKASLSEEDLKELGQIERYESLREARQEVERQKMRLDLARREAAVRANLADGAKIATIEIEGHKDTYIIAHVERAFRTYKAAIDRKSDGKKIDREGLVVNYAVEVVQDWNGHVDWTAMVPGGNTAGAALVNHLKANFAQALAIVNEAVVLSGLAAEARKSTG